MKKYLTWKNFNKVITSTQFLVLLFGIIFTIFQIQDIKNNQLNRKNDLSIRYYDKLNSSVNRQIGITIDQSKPILKINGGKFNEEDLNDYLGVLHDTGLALGVGLLDNDVTCSSFSYSTQKIWESEEVRSYIFEIRKEDPKYFLGFDDLYYFTKGCK